MRKNDSVMREFDEKFNKIEVFCDKDSGGHYSMITPKDRHKYDEYGLEDIKDFIRHSLAEARREWVEEMRGKANPIRPLTIKQKEVLSYFIAEGELNLAKTSRHFKKSTSTIYQILQSLVAKGWLIHYKNQVPAYKDMAITGLEYQYKCKKCKTFFKINHWVDVPGAVCDTCFDELTEIKTHTDWKRYHRKMSDLLTGDNPEEDK